MNVFEEELNALTTSDFRNVTPEAVKERFGGSLAADRRARDWVKAWLPHRYGAEWVPEVIRIANEESFSEEMLFNFLTDVSWYARSVGMSASKYISPDQLNNYEISDDEYCLSIILLQSARFDFDFPLVEKVLDESNSLQLSRNKDISQAFRFFATVGGANRYEEVPEAVKKNILEMKYTKLKHLALHGLSLSRFRRHGVFMTELATVIIQYGGRDGRENALYRQADGLRRQAGMEDKYPQAHALYAQALDSIDRALSLLDPGATLVHSDYVRERSFILTEWETRERLENTLTAYLDTFDRRMNMLAEKATASTRAQVSGVNERLRELDGENRAMLFRILEILALFVALIGLLATTVGSAFTPGLGVVERIAIILSGSVFLVFFYLAIHLIVRKVKGDGHKRAARDQVREAFREEIMDVIAEKEKENPDTYSQRIGEALIRLLRKNDNLDVRKTRETLLESLKRYTLEL